VGNHFLGGKTGEIPTGSNPGTTPGKGKNSFLSISGLTKIPRGNPEKTPGWGTKNFRKTAGWDRPEQPGENFPPHYQFGPWETRGSFRRTGGLPGPHSGRLTKLVHPIPTAIKNNARGNPGTGEKKPGAAISLNLPRGPEKGHTPRIPHSTYKRGRSQHTGGENRRDGSGRKTQQTGAPNEGRTLKQRATRQTSSGKPPGIRRESPRLREGAITSGRALSAEGKLVRKTKTPTDNNQQHRDQATRPNRPSPRERERTDATEQGLEQQNRRRTNTQPAEARPRTERTPNRGQTTTQADNEHPKQAA